MFELVYYVFTFYICDIYIDQIFIYYVNKSQLVVVFNLIFFLKQVLLTYAPKGTTR